MNFSQHLVLPLCSSLTFLTLGVLVFNIKIDKTLKDKFFRFCYTTFHWQFCWFFLFALNDPEAAKWVIKFGYSGIIFLPITFYDFVLSYIGKRPKIEWFYGLGVVFLLINWFSDGFIQGYHLYYFGFYPEAGIPWHLLYLWMVSYIIVSMLLHLKSHLRTPGLPLSRKNAVKYLFGAVFIYCLAAGDFLLNYPQVLEAMKITIYPFGNIFIMVAAAILTFVLGFEEVSVLNDKLEEFNKTLEDRIKKATVELKRVNDQNQYLVNVFTHDIKNRMYAFTYRFRSCIERFPEKESFLNELLNTSENIFRMSANLINVFSKEKIVLNKKSVQVSNILSSIQEKWESLFLDKEISFSIHSQVSASVIVDPEYMDLVWANLMVNAFEHTTPGGFFQLECEEQNSLVYFAFKNSVASRSALPDVFKKYARPEQQNPYNKGLGLHSAKMMVEMHGGSIECRQLGSEDLPVCELRLAIPIS